MRRESVHCSNATTDSRRKLHRNVTYPRKGKIEKGRSEHSVTNFSSLPSLCRDTSIQTQFYQSLYEGSTLAHHAYEGMVTSLTEG